MFQASSTFSHALAVEGSPELQAAMVSQQNLKREVASFIDVEIRPSVAEKYINWSIEIDGAFPNFALFLNVPPYKGVNLQEVYGSLSRQFDDLIFEGFHLQVTTFRERDKLRSNSKSLQTESSRSSSSQARWADAQMTMYASVEFIEEVQRLRSLSGVEQIEEVRYKDLDDPYSPYCSDAAAEAGKRILREMPVPDLREGGMAFPVWGDLNLEWHQHGYDVTIRITQEGAIQTLWARKHGTDIDVDHQFNPPISVNELLHKLEKSQAVFSTVSLQTLECSRD